jgi:tetratricopeptide (TPR) repeat protein
MLKKMLIIGNLLFLTVFCYSQTNLVKGEEFLMKNNPAQALIYLERALAEDPVNVTTHFYLGIVYEQLGRANDAINIYTRALPRAGGLSANVAGNLGNVYFSRGNITEAEQFYTQALSFNSRYSSAYLGRANTRIKSGQLLNAVTDYEQYLTLEPGSSQRDNIEKLISLIRTEIAVEEMRKQLAEEEAKRVEAERQKLLESVSASLQSLSSKSISSGAESVEQYSGDFELE